MNSITPPLKFEYSTDAGATLILICSIASKFKGLLCDGYPLPFRPKSSLNETPSTLMSLDLGWAPPILIASSPSSASSKDTRGFNLIRSLISRVIEGVF